MVDLPIPQQRLVTTEAPRPSVSPRERAAAGALIGNGLTNFGKGLEDVSVELAKMEGAEAAKKAITIGPDGRTTVGTVEGSFILNKRAADGYVGAVNDAVAPAVRTEIEQTMLDIRNKHRGDPQAFLKEAGDYVRHYQNSTDAVGKMKFQYAERIAGLHYSNEVNAKAGRDVEIARKEMDGRLSTIENRMNGLADQGAVNTDEYKRLIEERKAIYDRLQANPLMKVSPELRRQYDEAFAQRQLETGIIGRYRRIYEQNKDFPATVKQLTDEIDKLPISQDRKLQMIGKVRAHLAGSAAVNAEQKNALREKIPGMVSRMFADGSIDEKEYQEFAGQLRAARMFKELAELNTKKALAPAYWTMAQGNPAATAQAMEYVKSLQREPAVKDITPGAINARAGVNTGALQEDVKTRVSALQKQAEAAGVPFVVTSGFRDAAHNARVGGARGSQHTHGNAVDIKLPSDPEKARKLVQIIADSGVPGMGYYPNSNSIHIDFRGGGAATWGTNYSKSSIGVGGDAEIWRIVTSRKVTPGNVADIGAPPAFLRKPLEDYQSIYNKGVGALFTDMKKAYEANVAPPADTFAAFTAMAGSVSDPKLFKEMREFFDKQDIEKRFDGLPVAQARAAIQQMQILGEKGLLRQGQIAALKPVTEELDKRQKQIVSNPLGLAKADATLPEGLRTVAPLDFSTPGALASGMKQRAGLLNVFRQKEGSASFRALEPEEVPAAKQAWENADVPTRIRMVTELASGLDARTLRDTMQQMAGNGSELFAAAGVIAKQNPNLAGSIIRGQAYLDQSMVKVKDDVATTQELQRQLPPNMMGQKQWSAYKDLIFARYADLMGGKADAVVNTSKLRQAVQDVTGGTIDYGRVRLIAPWPGATYNDFRQAVRMIEPGDLNGATYANGKPVVPEEIRSKANFVSVGDGLYRPFFGDDPNSGWVRMPDGKPLVINLGAKKGRTPLPEMRPAPVQDFMP